jgi:hypothetical protein
MITKSEEQKPEPDWKKKWYDDAEKIRMGTVTVINFHMSKLNCMQLLQNSIYGTRTSWKK